MRKGFLLCFLLASGLIGYLIWRSVPKPERHFTQQEQVQQTSNVAPAYVHRSRQQAELADTNAQAPAEPRTIVATNLSFINGKQVLTVVTQVVEPQPPPDYEAGRQRLQEWREKNANEGIDQDIAERENKLKELALALQIGMTAQQVVEIMAKPDRIYLQVVEPGKISHPTIDVAELPDYVGKARWIELSYTPYGSTDYLNYRGWKMRFKPYDNLRLSFGADGKLKSITWGW